MTTQSTLGKSNGSRLTRVISGVKTSGIIITLISLVTYPAILTYLKVSAGKLPSGVPTEIEMGILVFAFGTILGLALIGISIISSQHLRDASDPEKAHPAMATVAKLVGLAVVLFIMQIVLAVIVFILYLWFD